MHAHRWNTDLHQWERALRYRALQNTTTRSPSFMRELKRSRKCGVTEVAYLGKWTRLSEKKTAEEARKS
jgi:hypothetical protein